MMVWTRPESAKFPAVYTSFEKTAKDGKIHKFIVQDTPEELFDFLVAHMTETFARDEPLCRATELIKDEESVRGCQRFWREVLQQKATITCFEIISSGEKKFAGCNMTAVSCKGDAEDWTNVIGEPWKKVYGCVSYVSHLVDPYGKFKTDKYLTALGLSVLPEYRGMNLGKEILNARTELCQAIGLTLTVTVFTNVASQIVAERAGFQDLLSIDYDELQKTNPLFTFPGVTKTTKQIRIMYKEIK